jgi:Ca2+-binding EF-hand superfamily protein
MKTSYLLISIISVGLASLALAQPGPGGGRGPRGPQAPRGHRPPPVLAVLDTNRDGVISAEEITNAPASLRTLDKNGDGIVTFEELHPYRPADAPLPPDDVKLLHRGNPVMMALDADADGALSAQEIANAGSSLKAIDLNQDGQLTADELRPLPPEDARPRRR